MSAFGGKADISGPLADDIAVRKPLNMPFLRTVVSECSLCPLRPLYEL